MQEWALDFILLEESQSRPLYLLAFFAGAIISSYTVQVDYRLGRAKWVMRIGIATLALYLCQIYWLMSAEAVTGGYLATLIITDFGLTFAYGFMLSMWARARSNDAYGTTRKAWYAFVPIANIWFALKGPHDGARTHADWKHYPVSILLTTVGICAMLLGIAFNYVMAQTVMGKVGLNPEAAAIIQRHRSGKQTAEQILREIAASVRGEQKIAQTLTLISAKSVGPRLDFEYRTTLTQGFIPPGFMREVKKSVCSNTTMMAALEKGGRLTYTFIEEASGNRWPAEEITREVCSNPNAFADRTQTPESVEETLLKDPMAGPMITAIKSLFPDEYSGILSDFTKLAQSGKPASEVVAESGVLVARLRRSLAEHLKSAPSENLDAVLHYQSEIYRSLSASSDACNTAIMYGPARLTSAQRAPAMGALSQSDVLFHAMAAGKNHPFRYRDVTDDDWTNVWHLFFTNGGTEKELEAILTPDMSNPLLCEAYIRLIDTLRAYDGPASAAVKAHFVYTVAKS